MKLKGKKVLVTGGAGFVGHHLVGELIDRGCEVRVADNLSKGEANNLKEHTENPRFEFVQADLNSPEKAKGVFKDCDLCFHLAAQIGGIGYFHKYPASILRDNSMMTLNVFDAARKSDAMVIYSSSSMVFERTNTFPTPEKALKTSPPPMTSYGFSKLVGEYIARAYNDEFGLPFLIVRFFNAYGPGEAPGDYVGYSHVIPDFIKKILSGEYPLKILGSGNQTRCYTYVKDIVDGMIFVTEKTKNDDFNISSERETSVKELAEILWKLCGRKDKLKFKHLSPFEHDVQKRIPDTGKIKGLGWRPKTDLEDGLKVTLEWLKDRL